MRQSNGRDDALRLLAGSEAVGPEFFRTAARALALGLGCRWAGFASLCADGQSVEILALSDGDRLVAPFNYPLAGGPCEAVYQSRQQAAYHFLASVPGAPLARRPAPMALAGPFSYRGEAIFDHDGAHCAHAFAIADVGCEDDAADRDFFRLVARRAGAEFNRLGDIDALRRAKAEAESNCRAKTEYLVRLADVMRTPLNAAIGFSEVIRDMPDSSFAAGSSREYASEILSIGTHLRRLVDDVHLMAKIERDALALDEEPFDLNRLARDCGALVADSAERSGVALSISAHRSPMTVLADPGLLKRVLLKLLVNAIQFTPRNGQVEVSVGLGPDGGPEICIADSGVGMAPAEMEAALTPFLRPSSREGGGGLGLPLARALCVLHGGALDIASASGSGTSARIRLPVSRRLRSAGLRAVA